MQLTITEAMRIFGKLEIETVKCKHHVRGFMVVDGVRVFAVHCSRGKKALPGKVPQKFRKSLHLSTSEFEQLRGCSLSRNAFVELLRQKGLL